MKILRDFRSEFTTWDSLIREVKLKRISCPDITHLKFVNALKVIEGVSHKKLLTSPRFEYITSLLNQARYYTIDRDVEHWSFVHEIYGISRLIKLIKKRVLNSEKLFNADIFSNFGMYSQFLMTAYLCKKLRVIDVEVKNPPLNTDILCEHKGTIIHFHIKNISESDREERLESAIYAIDHILSNRARARDAKHTLSVSSFVGIPPEGLPENYWEDFAKGVEEKSQTIKLNIPAGPPTKNTEEIGITIGFKWREYSGIFNGPKTNFNNWQRMVAEYDKIDGNLKAKSINVSHVLVAISDDKYSWKGIKKSLKNEKLGLAFFEIVEFRFDRSPFLFPTQFFKTEYLLNKVFPESIEFIFKK